MLTHLSLFALVKNCPSLSEIKMNYTSIGKQCVENSNSLLDFVVNPQLKSLYLAHNSCLRDENLIMFASIFPNLQLIDLSYCDNISDKSICQVLKRWSKIRHLNLAHCSRVKLYGMNIRVLKLEVLSLIDTRVDDEALHVISKSCCGLLQLLLQNCEGITETGVKHVVKNCTRLREINLRGCNKVHYNVVAPMVFSRPSLRKIVAPIVAPPRYLSSAKRRELFLRHGCIID